MLALHFNGQNDGWLWEQVSSKNFYGKDTGSHSCYSYITQKDDKAKVISGMQSSEYGHDLWAEEMQFYKGE